MPRDIRARPPPAETDDGCTAGVPPPPDPVRQLPRPSDPAGPRGHERRPGRALLHLHAPAAGLDPLAAPAAGGTGSAVPVAATGKQGPLLLRTCAQCPPPDTLLNAADSGRGRGGKAWKGAPAQVMCRGRTEGVRCARHSATHACTPCGPFAGRFRQAGNRAGWHWQRQACTQTTTAGGRRGQPHGTLHDHGPRGAHAHGKEKGPAVSDDGPPRSRTFIIRLRL
jgi:hypothetical protein